MDIEEAAARMSNQPPIAHQQRAPGKMKYNQSGVIFDKGLFPCFVRIILYIPGTRMA
jgi:hypothetical protein